MKEIVYIAQLHGALRLTADGAWYHNGVRFENLKLAELFSRSIVWEPAEESYFVEIGNQRATFSCDDTAYFVTNIDDSRDPWRITVSDGSSELLDPASLVMGEAGRVYCSVRGNSDRPCPERGHRALFLRAAHQTLARHVVSDEEIQIGQSRVKMK